MADQKHIPAVIWAQRNDRLYVTINVEDCKNAVVNFNEKGLSFSGKGGAEHLDYELVLEFYKKINPKESKFAVLSRHIPMVIKKEDGGPYWPRLITGTNKVHWLKTDFEKWRDEDDSDVDERKDSEFEDMMSKMGQFDTSGSKDMLPGDDSDDEELPDLE